MGLLDIIGRIVSIFGGIVSGLTGVLALTEKCQSYIERRKGQTKKDPSASFAASDGSADDCLGNQ